MFSMEAILDIEKGVVGRWMGPDQLKEITADCEDCEGAVISSYWSQ